MLVVLSGMLRLMQLDLIDLRYDEAMALVLAYDIAHGAAYAVVPFSGSIANHPPLWIYTLSVPYFVTNDMLVASAWRILWDVAAVGICALMCVRGFGKRMAIVPTMMFAVAPWAIWFSRKLGVASSPISSALILLGFIEAMQLRRPVGWYIAGTGMAIALASHLASLYFVPPFVLALALGWRSGNHKHVIIALVPPIMVALLYGWHDAGQGFASLRAIAASTVGDVRLDFDSIRFASWMTGGSHLGDISAESFDKWQTQPIQALAWLDTIQQLTMWLSIAVLALAAVNEKVRIQMGIHRQLAIAMSLWILLPIILYLRHTGGMQIHYLSLLWPAPFVVYGLALRFVWRSKSLFTRVALVAVTLVISGWHVATTVRFNEFVEGIGTSAHRPARWWLEAAVAAHSLSCAPGPMCTNNLIVLAKGDNPYVDTEPTIWQAVLNGTDFRVIDVRDALLVPADTATFVGIDRPEVTTALNQIAEITNEYLHYTLRSGSDAFDMARVGGLNPYVVPAAAALPGFSTAMVTHWANGIDLIGARSSVSRDIETITIWLQVNKSQVGGENFHWTHRKIVDGKQVWQHDLAGVAAANWRVGDILIHHFTIPVLPDIGSSQLHIGEYRYPSIETVNAATPAGAFEDGVTIDLRSIR